MSQTPPDPTTAQPNSAAAPPPPPAGGPAPNAAPPVAPYPQGLASPATKEENTWAMVAHISALAGLTGIPFANVVAPLIVWLVKKDTMPFVDDQGKESLNFQITVTIALLICVPLLFVLIGFLLMPIIGLVALIFTIIAAVAANNGQAYRYPMCLRIIK